ncbi:MAG: Crp/Fnr family transcriptional regulator [Methylobacterium mesophilicum]|nr:Crp/Fnr family transcriptional regulator [Methylobacterium mesophilicum]
MPNAFIRKLEGFAPLDAADRQFLAELTARTVSFEADQAIINEGDHPRNVHLVLEGLAARAKTLRDGSRQIVAYLVPGDFCDFHVAILNEMDHDIVTLTPCSIVRIPKDVVKDIIDNRPRLAKSFWWCTLVDEATLREWVTNLGQRSAEQRIAHLFCELYTRLKAVGLVENGSFTLPINQAELGDTMGLSPVHVNRSLKGLRDSNLATFRGKTICIPNIERLKSFADFKSNYLHFQNDRVLERQA